MTQEQDKERAQPVAWRCDWEYWTQFHHEGDPLPKTWDSPPDTITPLYAAPQPNAALADGWVAVPVKPTEAMLEVFNASDAYFIRYNKENRASERYETVSRVSFEVVGAFADEYEADALAARLSYTEHYRAMLAAAPPTLNASKER